MSNAILASLFWATSLLVVGMFARYHTVKFTAWDLMAMMIILMFFITLALFFTKLFLKSDS